MINVNKQKLNESRSLGQLNYKKDNNKDMVSEIQSRIKNHKNKKSVDPLGIITP